jgi:hypothetical protein
MNGGAARPRDREPSTPREDSERRGTVLARGQSRRTIPNQAKEAPAPVGLFALSAIVRREARPSVSGAGPPVLALADPGAEITVPWAGGHLRPMWPRACRPPGPSSASPAELPSPNSLVSQAGRMTRTPEPSLDALAAEPDRAATLAPAAARPRPGRQTSRGRRMPRALPPPYCACFAGFAGRNTDTAAEEAGP